MRRFALTASLLAVVAMALVAPGCAIAMPFRGPGWDGAPTVARDEYVVVLTHAVLDGETRASFDGGFDPVRAQLDGAEGLVGYSMRKELLGDEVWTMSVWQDEASLKRFLYRGAHRDVMRDGAIAIETGDFRRFTIPASDVPPTWSQALAWLEDPELGRDAY